MKQKAMTEFRRKMPDDGEIQYDEQEDVERTLLKFNTPYSGICLFEETGDKVFLYKWDWKCQILSASSVTRCILWTFSLVQVPDCTLS